MQLQSKKWTKNHPRPNLGRNPQKRDQNLYLQPQKSTKIHARPDIGLKP